jgi:uncharacterized membrane protein
VSWYLLLKYVHVLLAITAFGSNITYAVWSGLAGADKDKMSFALRGIKFLDDRVANPAYLLLAVTGLTLAAVGHLPYTTPWITTAIIIYVVLVVVGFAFYSPVVVAQIRALESEGLGSRAYESAAIRQAVVGSALLMVALALIFMMVVKPRLW